METKSRYEVISELESKKRELINERNGLGQKLLDRQKEQRDVERQRDDTVVILNRKIDDIKEGIKNFESAIAERKETITELIKSVDDSLERFNKINREK